MPPKRKTRATNEKAPPADTENPLVDEQTANDGKKRRTQTSKSDKKATDKKSTLTTTSTGTTLLCLLRGVNIGSKQMKMTDLAGLFETEGFLRVRTYIQSGNVVFTRPDNHPVSLEALPSHLENCIQDSIQFDSVPVCLKTVQQMETILSTNPYLAEKQVDTKHLHVTFLCSTISKHPFLETMNGATNPSTENDTYRLSEGSSEIFVHTPNGYGRTKINTNAIEKAAGVIATTRNWNSCNKLYQMMLE